MPSRDHRQSGWREVYEPSRRNFRIICPRRGRISLAFPAAEGRTRGLEALLDSNAPSGVRALKYYIFEAASDDDVAVRPVETSRVPKCTPGNGHSQWRAGKMRDWYRARKTSQLTRETQFWLVVVPLRWRSRISDLNTSRARAPQEARHRKSCKHADSGDFWCRRRRSLCLETGALECACRRHLQKCYGLWNETRKRILQYVFSRYTLEYPNAEIVYEVIFNFMNNILQRTYEKRGKEINIIYWISVYQCKINPVYLTAIVSLR